MTTTNPELVAAMIWAQLTTTQQTQVFQLLVKLCWQVAQSAANGQGDQDNVQSKASEGSDERS